MLRLNNTVLPLSKPPPHKIEEILVISIFHFFNFFFSKKIQVNIIEENQKIVKLTTQTLFDPKFMRLTIFLLIDSIMFMQSNNH